MAFKRRRDDIHETPDVSYIRNEDVAHEHTDVPVAPVLKFVFGLLVFSVFIFIAMYLMFLYLDRREQRAERRPSPLARRGEEALPPEPRLQVAPGFGVTLPSGERVNLEQRPEPQAEYRVVSGIWNEQLNNYGWVDKEAGTVRLPIERAKELYLQRQQQKNPAPSASPAPQNRQEQQQQSAPAGERNAQGQQTAPSQSSSGHQNDIKHQ